MIWLILGMLIGAGVVWLIYRIKEGKVKIKWYQWLLGAIAVILMLLTIENYIGFMEEMEPQAVGFILWAMGLPALLFGVLAVVIPKLIDRKVKPKKTSVSSS